MKLSTSELKEFLDKKVDEFNRPSFIADDPISIPHNYTLKEDIEISGFLTATISWGNRKMIIRNSQRMMNMLDNSPYDFITNYSQGDLVKLEHFVHRTFNSDDFIFFVQSLKNIYNNRGGLENIFRSYITNDSLQPAIHKLNNIFFELPHLKRTERHISDPFKGSAAKRINMFLRWMVRKDDRGVDFGLWRSIPTSALSCPLDVHSGNVARRLGMLTRKQNDAKALAELDGVLRSLDRIDPVKYDFALFGMGVSRYY